MLLLAMCLGRRRIVALVQRPEEQVGEIASHPRRRVGSGDVEQPLCGQIIAEQHLNASEMERDRRVAVHQQRAVQRVDRPS
jgi:hypothetical protein